LTGRRRAWQCAFLLRLEPLDSRPSAILMLSAVGRFSGIVPPSSRMVFRRRKGMRAIEATTFNRVGDLFAWHPRVEPQGEV